MSLKILSMPLFVICTLVIAISYIKPDISLLMKKHNQTKYLGNQLVSLETIASNIRSMQSQIETSQSDSESTMTDAHFLRSIYFPTSSDIEKGIDQLNFLADQSGVVVSNVEVEDAKKADPVPVVVDDSVADSAALLIAKADGEDFIEEDVTSVHRTYVPDTFLVTIEIAGSYEAMRDFYARIVHAKRLFLPVRVKISTKENTQAPGGAPVEEADSGILYSTLEARFLLLPAVSLTSAVGDDVFLKNTLDFETLAAIRQNKQGVTPELPPANPLGKANPFVK